MWGCNATEEAAKPARPRRLGFTSQVRRPRAPARARARPPNLCLAADSELAGGGEGD